MLDVELELFACDPFDGEGGSIVLFLLLGDADDDAFLLAIGLKMLLKLPRLLCFLLLVGDLLLSSSDESE